MNTERLAGATWFKSSRSNGQGACVEVAFLEGGQVAMRDSKASNGSTLVFPTGSWGAFVGGADDGNVRRL